MESILVYTSYIRATPQAVWQALTTNAMLTRYWMGAVFESDWSLGSPWQNAWKPEFAAEGESPCVYQIEPAGAAVKLTVRHSIGHADSPFIQSVLEAWPICISHLKSLLETGDIALADNPRHGN